MVREYFIIVYTPGYINPIERRDGAFCYNWNKTSLFRSFQFVAHPNIQQLLAAIWYEGRPRVISPMKKIAEISLISILFPLYCALYLIAPSSAYAQLMRKPFMKFWIHASSYLFFLCKSIINGDKCWQIVLNYILPKFSWFWCRNALTSWSLKFLAPNRCVGISKTNWNVNGVTGPHFSNVLSLFTSSVSIKYIEAYPQN